jgi:hypothetical protein
MHPSSSIRLLAALLAGGSVTPVFADWRSEIGFTRLQALAGGALPTAPSQGLTQAEGVNASGYYAPNTASSLFSNKTFAFKSGPSGTSNHANHVAENFYGGNSLLPGSAAVDLYNADDWIGSGFLRFATNSAPLVETRAVQNHSWIYTPSVTPPVPALTEEQVAEFNMRLDFAINRDGFSCVVGTNNDIPNPLPQWLVQSYHTISVGRDDGYHAAGVTAHDGAGRVKPDIVAPSAAPEYATSWTTPMVASAAGLLHAGLSAAPHSRGGADLPRVTKALLLASATKDTVPNWDNTTTRPLDERYGAGELNIHHAWLALSAGRKSSGNTTHGIRGWAAESVNGNSSKTWFFTIPAGPVSTPFCAALTWHRTVSDGLPLLPWGNLSASLTDFDMRLHQASGFTVGSQIAESASAVDNVELIHQPALAPGSYAIVVQNYSGANTALALAWHSLPSVTIAATQPVAKEINGQQATVTLARTGDTTLPMQVPLAFGGTAVSGTHYQALPGTVTIPAGQSSLALLVTPIADSLAQGSRTLSIAVAADFALVRDAAQSANVTIEDKPFDAWRFANFTPAERANPNISGETADPDADNLDNLIEYALGLPPKTPGPSPAAAGKLGGYLSLTFNKSSTATDITWSAQVTPDLSVWQTAQIITNNTTTFSARDTVLMSGAGRRFIRLKITRP